MGDNINNEACEDDEIPDADDMDPDMDYDIISELEEGSFASIREVILDVDNRPQDDEDDHDDSDSSDSFEQGLYMSKVGSKDDDMSTILRRLLFGYLFLFRSNYKFSIFLVFQ
ncbi:uncharacterized protein LOC130768608 [Actinidia eriantha]|uniref:uncharacterized protein LOC130768608 n=1 Tax=Actinidia eriantha TaxID=165200 RepID=UPI00258DC97B|nr:uncharacterized protein LOC130768608 [Actinidia eriantha]